MEFLIRTKYRKTVKNLSVTILPLRVVKIPTAATAILPSNHLNVSVRSRIKINRLNRNRGAVTGEVKIFLTEDRRGKSRTAAPTRVTMRDRLKGSAEKIPSGLEISSLKNILEKIRRVVDMIRRCLNILNPM